MRLDVHSDACLHRGSTCTQDVVLLFSYSIKYHNLLQVLLSTRTTTTCTMSPWGPWAHIDFDLGPLWTPKWPHVGLDMASCWASSGTMLASTWSHVGPQDGLMLRVNIPLMLRVQHGPPYFGWRAPIPRILQCTGPSRKTWFSM